MNNYETEELREKILSDIYASAFSGTPATILDENKVKNASKEELEEIAKKYSY